jgi:hypothetical protein
MLARRVLSIAQPLLIACGRASARQFSARLHTNYEESIDA